ncbi:MAG: complex I NDUFA9 subunit family protein [Hydrogenothermaceae bacterium]|nr:complex I NDUFA9 subunit family protein [Hydrogenothermaceae bacterium]
MKIVIYGASGFIGSYVVNALKGHELVVPLRNLEKKERPFKQLESIKFTSFNQKRPGNTILEEKPDVVINLIGILREDIDNGITFENVHFQLSKDLIDVSKEASILKFIQMSALGADLNARSIYLKTKAMAEEYLISSGLNYIIFRPSIVMGREQRLFNDLKKYSKIAPFFLAPIDAKVQPVHVLDVAESFKKAVEDDGIKNQIFELCGNRVINFKELFEFGLLYTDVNRIVVGVPKKLFLPLLPFFYILPEPVMTVDQYYMMDKDNVCSKKMKGIKDLLGKVRDAFMI